MRLDTVATAASDPDHAQPWAELGLKEDEYARIREILGRRPTSAGGTGSTCGAVSGMTAPRHVSTWRSG